MAYEHGVKTNEQPTSLATMTEVDSGIIVAFGAAPVHLTKEYKVNEPVLCYTYAEAISAMGYSADWKHYTLCEVIKEQFGYYNMAPLVLVNVLDPARHKKSTSKQVTMVKGTGRVDNAVLLDTLTVALTADGEPLAEGVDYKAAYEGGELVITALKEGALIGKEEAFLMFDEADPSKVTKDDIIGGVDADTGKSTGLELIHEIYARFGIVPGIIIAPGFSGNSAVAAAMAGKTENIGGLFGAVAICDIPTDEVKVYTEASKWKDDNSIADKNVVVCWPMVKLDNEISHLSTHIASIMNKVDSEHDGLPYYAPSNKLLKADGACLADGTEIYLNNTQAEYVNGQGITTALNFIGGWRSWGVQTAAYPSNTDVKDNQIVNRRMINWVGNTLITTFWSQIDNPGNKALIRIVVDSANIFLNGLVARGALLGASVEFRADENPTTDLMAGIFRFHVSMTPPAAARKIEFIQEYDPQYINALFAS